MPRYDDLHFVVYYNKSKKHVYKHKINCSFLESHGGEHKMKQGGYGYFVKEYEADIFAKGLGMLKELPEVHNCSNCL